MKRMRRLFYVAALLAALAVILSGCSSGAKKEIAAAEARKLSDLQNRLNQIEAEKNQLQARESSLQAELKKLADQEKLYLEKLDKYAMLRVPNKLVFGSGSTVITTDGKRILSGIADILKRYPDYELRIEGHTDNVQIKSEFQHKYASNWELSAARATGVVRLLVANYKMDPKKLGAVGYGEFRPIASNDISDGRSHNRRVEFYIAPIMKEKPLAM